MNRSVGRRVAVVLVVIVAVAGVAIAFVGSTALLGGSEGSAPASPRFVEEASPAGIDHSFGGEDRWYVGGGVAVFDCNDDHRPDLFLAGGAGPALLARNESEIGGSLSFTPVHDPVTDLSDVTGAYPLDVDGDAVERPGRVTPR